MSKFNALVNKLLQESIVRVNKRLEGNELHNFKILLFHCRRSLAQKDPFAFRVLETLRVVPTYDIETMAVDNKSNIYINPDFAFNLESRSIDLVTGVLAHETYHHSNRTFSRQQWRDGRLWNIATDYIMNRDLLEQGFSLPEEGCIPAKRSDGTYLVHVTQPMFTEEKDIDITNATCEYLYNRLDEILDRENDNRNEEGGEGGEGNEGGESSEGGKSGKGKLQTLDDHLNEKEAQSLRPATNDPSMQPKQGDPKQIDEELRKAIENAHTQTETLGDFSKDRPGNGKGGSMGRQLERQEALGRGQVNWVAILQRVLKNATERTRSTWSRLNSRALGAGRLVPGKIASQEKPEIVVALDASGSIGNPTLVKFLEEVMQITRIFDDYSITALVYSDNIIDTLTITPSTKTKIVSKLKAGPRWSGGGNNESCIKQWLDAKGIKKLELFILFTDGGVDGSAILPNANHTYFMVMKGNSDAILKQLRPNATTVWVNLPNTR